MRNSVQAELPAWSVSPQCRSILAGNFEEVSELTAVSGDLNALLVKLNSEFLVNQRLILRRSKTTQESKEVYDGLIIKVGSMLPAQPFRTFFVMNKEDTSGFQA
jgi:hypothetical protein